MGDMDVPRCNIAKCWVAIKRLLTTDGSRGTRTYTRARLQELYLWRVNELDLHAGATTEKISCAPFDYNTVRLTTAEDYHQAISQIAIDHGASNHTLGRKLLPKSSFTLIQPPITDVDVERIRDGELWLKNPSIKHFPCTFNLIDKKIQDIGLETLSRSKYFYCVDVLYYLPGFCFPEGSFVRAFHSHYEPVAFHRKIHQMDESLTGPSVTARAVG